MMILHHHLVVVLLYIVTTQYKASSIACAISTIRTNEVIR